MATGDQLKKLLEVKAIAPPRKTNIIRHVRTPEGARRFGVPIGSVIDADGNVRNAAGKLIGKIKPSLIAGPSKLRKTPAPALPTPKPKRQLTTAVRLKVIAERSHQESRVSIARKPVRSMPAFKPVPRNGRNAALLPGGKRYHPASTPQRKQASARRLARSTGFRMKAMGTPRPEVPPETYRISTKGKTWKQIRKETGLSYAKLFKMNGIKDPGTRSRKVLDGLLPENLTVSSVATRARSKAAIRAGRQWDKQARAEKRIAQKRIRNYAKNTWSGMKKGTDANGRTRNYMTFDSDRLGTPGSSRQRGIIWQNGDGTWSGQVGAIVRKSNSVAKTRHMLDAYLPVSGQAKERNHQRGIATRQALSSNVDPKIRDAQTRAKTLKERKIKQAKARAKRQARELKKRQAAMARALRDRERRISRAAKPGLRGPTVIGGTRG